VREAGIAVREIIMQTNGLHFLRADSRVLETELRSLIDLGVTDLEFTGFGPNQIGQILPEGRIDYWIEEYARVVETKLVALGLSVTSFGRSGLITRPGAESGPLAGRPLQALFKADITNQHLLFSPQTYVPLGRASRFPETIRRRQCSLERGFYEAAKKTSEDDFVPSYTVDFMGNIYLCCYGKLRIGSLLEDPFEAVIDKVRHSQRYAEVITFYDRLAAGEAVDDLPTVPCAICKRTGT
jgi:hypothetical protein